MHGWQLPAPQPNENLSLRCQLTVSESQETETLLYFNCLFLKYYASCLIDAKECTKKDSGIKNYFMPSPRVAYDKEI